MCHAGDGKSMTFAPSARVPHARLARQRSKHEVALSLRPHPSRRLACREAPQGEERYRRKGVVSVSVPHAEERRRRVSKHEAVGTVPLSRLRRSAGTTALHSQRLRRPGERGAGRAFLSSPREAAREAASLARKRGETARRRARSLFHSVPRTPRGERGAPSGAPSRRFPAFGTALRGLRSASSSGLGRPPSGRPSAREGFDERPLSWLPAPDRSVRGRGPEASRERGCEPRARAPHLHEARISPGAGHRIRAAHLRRRPPVRPATATPRESAPRRTRRGLSGIYSYCCQAARGQERGPSIIDI
jgi:hypothetical protein